MDRGEFNTLIKNPANKTFKKIRMLLQKGFQPNNDPAKTISKYYIPCSLAKTLRHVNKTTIQFGLHNAKFMAINAKKLHNKSALPTMPQIASVKTG